MAARKSRRQTERASRPERGVHAASMSKASERADAKRAEARAPGRSLGKKMASDLCSLERYRGESLTIKDLIERHRPGSRRSAFATARYWQEYNYFIGAILYLKASYVNFGLTLKPADKAKKAEFEAWLASDEGKTRMDVEKYIQSATEEYLLHDNLVSFWREDGDYPYPLKCEQCKYTDAMGVQIMKVVLGFKPEDFKGGDFSKEEIKRYSTGEITLDEKYGEFFEVLTRVARGRGLGHPRLSQVFLAASEAESIEVGESMLAYAARSVIRMHHLGWEVKKDAGVRQSDAMWDAERATGIEEDFQDGNMVGVKNATANFDHKISHIWALNDIKLDGKKWETVAERMKWWGGPLAFMLMSRNLNPDLLPMFLAEVQKLRQELRLHLQYVLNKSMGPPGGLKLVWGNRCFINPKLFWEMMKTLMQQGPLPLQTALKAADVDAERAAELKLEEADDKDSKKKYLPLFDKDHGKRPDEPKGRKEGTKDGDGK